MEGMTVTALYGMDSTERLQTFERVCHLGERVGDTPALFRGLLNLGFVHTDRFEARRALEIAQRCVKLDEQDPNEMLPAAHTVLAQALHRSGDLLQAASVGSRALNGLTSPHQRAAGLTSANLWTITPLTLALIAQKLGRPDEALKLGYESLRRARELKHSFSLVSALHIASLLHYERREPEAAREHAEAVIELAEEQGFRGFSVSGRALRAWAITRLGQIEEGIAELETIAVSVRRLMQISLSRILAHAYPPAGRAEEALVIIDEELAEIEHSGAYLEAAELRRMKGEAILIRDSSATAEAEACFRKAIEIAKGQSAKWWELRATVSLAALLRDAGRRDEARAMLAEIFGWFTEGFDTPDLKDAKTLLDELQS
jgi:adenylate cyclase